MSDDFVFRGSVADLDPELYELLERERVRQDNTIILIPSESAAPPAVEEAMGSKFGNIYAEGYPRESSRRQTEAEIVDFEKELALYRRNSDPRYYKGVEYADVLEALTRRRAAELFAANGIAADQLYVNVQPLSGGPANSALYTAILKPGDTIMGLKLSDGGHLSHGAPVNRSGSIYNSISYVVDSETEQLDYEAIEKLALEVKPQVIVAGFSAYPLIIDWQRFRDIADKVGAHFHADIAHISGLVAAGVHPSPIGIADSVMTTTHKSLCGPRGAMLMTHRADLSDKIDKAVFPGEQGGGHFNTIGALALALKLAQSDQFVELQHRIVRNAGRLAEKLQERGLRVMCGRSENHLLLIDCKSVKNNYGLTLDGDSAARILDVVGIVTNRNTIPGDRSALVPSGVRIGTVWISQLGYGDAEIDLLAEAIATVLTNATPIEYAVKVRRRTRRAKVEPQALAHARSIVQQLTKQVARELPDEDHTLRIRGKSADGFLNDVLLTDVVKMAAGDTHVTALYVAGERIIANLHCGSSEKYYLRFADTVTAERAKLWLQDLSDGYMRVSDAYAKLAGPVTVETRHNIVLSAAETDEFESITKPFIAGMPIGDAPKGEPLPGFEWSEAGGELKTTGLHATHVAAGAKMIDFGGYDMPVWYTSVTDEHDAVRSGAGLFDVSHMGVFEAAGPTAECFLNTVLTNDVSRLGVGKSQYNYLLDPNGSVIDDLMIYRLAADRFLLVVNASNNDKDWAWLNAVNDRRVSLDNQRPSVSVQHSCTLTDVRAAGKLVLIALQGPQSATILSKLGGDERDLKRMRWATQKEMRFNDFNLIVSKSGYTGERVAFELFVSPDQVVDLWVALVAAGATQCGLAARDSTRIEAGLPLYGQELAGPYDLDPDTACFGMYVKLWKPFFVGREAYIKSFETHENTIVRFKMDDKNIRRPVHGDPIIDKRGRVVGVVTSCGIGSDGHMIGLALVPLAYRSRGSKLDIYQTSGGAKLPKSPAELKLGAKLPRPDTATVLSRFPSKKRK